MDVVSGCVGVYLVAIAGGVGGGSGMVVVSTRVAGYPSLLLVLLFSHCLVEVVYFFKACLGGFCWDSYGHYV